MQIVHHNPAEFEVGNAANVALRYPIGHYRVPMYMRGKQVKILRVLGLYINPEEEAFGRNAGSKIWSYLVTIQQKELWPEYQGHKNDRLEIEIFEPWLENLKLKIMSNNHAHTHDDHAPIIHDETPGYYEILEISIREFLIEKGLMDQRK